MNKKRDQIKKLLERQKSGEKLEKNQVNKLLNDKLLIIILINFFKSGRENCNFG